MSGSAPTAKCILGFSGNPKHSGKVIGFTEKSLKKCIEILQVRKLRGYKSSDVTLPSGVDALTGYHAGCYRDFTAVPKTHKSSSKLASENNVCVTSESLEQSESKFNVTNTIPSNSQISSKVILKCLFCDKFTKRYKERKEGLISGKKSTLENIVSKAALLSNDAVYHKLTSTDGIENPYQKYHKTCLARFLQEANNFKTQFSKSNTGHKHKLAHRRAISTIRSFVQKRIIELKETHLFEYVAELYQQILNKTIESMCFSKLVLRRKLLNIFKDKIFIKNIDKQLVILDAATYKFQEHLIRAKLKEQNTQTALRVIAFKLRDEIMSLENVFLPNFLSLTSSVEENDVEIPDMLNEFFRYLLTGPDPRYGNTEEINRRITALCSDSIYAVTKGRIKPRKHIQLGLAIKSLTSSRRVIEILNKFGHCVNYHYVEELETELAFSGDTLQPSFLVPGMSSEENVFTGLAFDNYDCFVETSNGKNTLHDTVGIAYQIMDLHSQPTTSNQADVSVTKGRKRRAYIPTNLEIEPYFKKPKILATLSDTTPSSDLNLCKQSVEKARQLDCIWLISLICGSKNTPMWNGWNSRHTTENLPQQKVFYLPPINLSPTSHSVVMETLKRSIKIADSCHQRYIFITYDLAIAKIALQIQHEESPNFDRAFILLGNFHIEMAYYKAIGKFFEGSGGDILLVNSGLLAQGSLNAFISGTHYNRCKRLHVLFSAAIQVLHFQAFIDEENVCVDDLRADIEFFENDETHKKQPASLNTTILRYQAYVAKTLSGFHGATAEYWMKYVNMINLRNNLSRSIRSGDLNLYIYSLNEITAYFFALNHQNYARWTVKVIDNLNNIGNTHPDLLEYVKKCGFGIKRTTTNFSMSAVDLTLEQTINADAANRLTGVASFTNSISARQKWAKTHTERTSNISALYTLLGMAKKDEISSNYNPFKDFGNKQNLFNICTGKSVSKDTKNFLLSLNMIGRNKRDTFVNDCRIDETKFESRISRTEIRNFAFENKINPRNKRSQIKMERNLMGRILCIASENLVDFKDVFKFPLTPIPQALGHLDGSMVRTDKFILQRQLTDGSFSVGPAPGHIDAIFVNGFYLLQSMTDLPYTFDKIAMHFLKKVCIMNANRIHIVFDRCISPSIRNIDGCYYSQDNTKYSILKRDQKRPADFSKSLKNGSFKKSFHSFLVSEWLRSEYFTPLFESKKEIYLTDDDKCFLFKTGHERVLREERQDLFSLQEEADTRMLLHVSFLSDNSSVVIKSSDTITDLLIQALYHLPYFKNNPNIWIEVGKNTLRYININNLYQKLGSTLCAALIGFHSFTGCDYSPAFFKKGKIKPFDILKKSPCLQELFGRLGNEAFVSKENILKLEKFVCEIYKSKALSVDSARYEIFFKTCKPTSDKIFENIKSFEGSLLPPNSTTLLEHIKRSNYISRVWKNALKNEPIVLSPAESGWELKQNSFEIKWFDGREAPDALQEILVNNDKDIIESDEEKLRCDSSDESDNACYD